MAVTESKKMALLACKALEDKKCEDLRVLDISNISTIADYFVIASGTNHNQVDAMADGVDEALSKAGFEPMHSEGTRSASWILMDYGDIIVHVFDRENRLFYDLDRIWRDGREVTVAELEEGEDNGSR